MTIRVLVVDDSRFICTRIANILEHDKELRVVGTAGNGREAISKTADLDPDVVTMDVEMPVMDGIAAVAEIMRQTPVPILMFSASTHIGAQATLDALEAGAVDFLPKQLDEIDGDRDTAKHLLRRRVRGVAMQAAKLKVRKLGKGLRHGRPEKLPQTLQVVHESHARPPIEQFRLLTIVASTGGPVAMQKILTQIPEHCSMPVLLVQHMPGKFTRSFAARLDQLCAIKVKEAEHGDPLLPGQALLAPGGMQMEIRGASRKHIILREKTAAELYSPCADITLTSIARHFPGQTLAVILTGMGADGAQGALQLKRGGSRIWAQDEQSCTIYGMPKAVVDAQLADRIYSLEKISCEFKKLN